MAKKKGGRQAVKSLQEFDFYTLWNMCKKSPNYDVEAWQAAETKLQNAFGITMEKVASLTERTEGIDGMGMVDDIDSAVIDAYSDD